jgi:hypothetical protein
VTLDDVQSLLDAPSPAVLTTYRKDGSALTTPVWFRFHDGAFEVVLAEGDLKRQHLAGHQPASLLCSKRFRRSGASRCRVSQGWLTAM